MILTTGDLEAVPVLMMQALAADGTGWTLEVEVDGDTFTGEVEHCDWTDLSIVGEDGSVLTIPLDEIDRVVVP